MLLTVQDFTELAMTAMPRLVRSLQDETGRFGDEESQAWRASLRTLAEVLDDADLGAFHIHLSRQSGNLSLEYRLPASSSWCDVVLLGRHNDQPTAVILELKNWDISQDQPGPRPGIIVHRGSPALHPSEQVRAYVEYCQRFHSAVISHRARVSGCAFFTKAHKAGAHIRPPHQQLTEQYPVFTVGPEDTKTKLPLYLRGNLAEPDRAFAEAFDRGHYAQDRNFVRAVANSVLEDVENQFVLLDGQRLGFERCLEFIDDLLASGTDTKHVVLIEGPPGSGKSVLAARLWATLAKDDRVDGSVVLVTTSGSQKSNWESLYKKVSKSSAARGIVIPANQFNPGLTPIWVKEQRELGRPTVIAEWKANLGTFARSKRSRIKDGELAATIVDEAHALIDPTAEGAEGIAPSGWCHHAGPQAWHVIRASKLSVFLLDPEQSYRDNETMTAAAIRRYAADHGARVLDTISLGDAQFRCAGSKEYLDWVQHLLSDVPGPATSTKWRASEHSPGFDFELVDDPAALDERLQSRIEQRRTVRLLASYGRPWRTKGVQDPHDLPLDQVDFNIHYRRGAHTKTWSRIWNYAPGQDYSLFVQSPVDSPMHRNPLGEVGCPYVVRGFDWDYTGILWLSDLVWRNDRWMPQLDHIHESAWKKTLAAAKKESKRGAHGTAMDALTQRLIRGYRILLTRAIRGAYIWCEDAETRARIESLLRNDG